MNLKKLSKLIFISVLIISINACGWHLRGIVDLPPELRVVAINPEDAYTPLHRLLRSMLNASGITVVSRNENPGAIIDIISDDVTRRTLTTSLTGDTTENLIRYTIRFQVLDPNGEILLPPTNINTESTALYNPNDLLGTAESENIVLDDLRFDAVNQLIQRYASVPLPESEPRPTEEDEVLPTFEPPPLIQ